MDWLVPFHPWIAVGATLIVFAALQLRRGAPVDLLFLGGLLAVTLTGVITPAEAFSGFSNTAVLTIAALLAVSGGIMAEQAVVVQAGAASGALGAAAFAWFAFKVIVRLRQPAAD